jgi:hypothetical protein
MRQYDVATYIWPSYHYEPRLEHAWPEKDGEWYTVRRGTARFPGHDMPRIPLLGYQDEADPAVMREHVALAREHGINVSSASRTRPSFRPWKAPTVSST